LISVLLIEFVKNFSFNVLASTVLFTLFAKCNVFKIYTTIAVTKEYNNANFVKKLDIYLHIYSWLLALIDDYVIRDISVTLLDESLVIEIPAANSENLYLLFDENNYIINLNTYLNNKGVNSMYITKDKPLTLRIDL